MHAVSRLLVQGQVQERTSRSAATRRWSQRQKAAQRLLDQPIKGWLQPKRDGERFWRSLRWGGAGMLLGWLLSQATNSGRS
ncbi:hypothetical protein [Parasynechococcus sp.]|uniref:hypothetical protein n=1 Tax=Parasynechococcus sp. TaxID=3101203 RepID=UPI0037044372